VRRLGIVLGVIAGVLVLALAAGVAAGFWQVRRGYPQYDGEIALPGLTSDVEVLRNSYGVPTVYADSPEDLFRAQGFLHAQDRFWEMDFRRLVAAGRLSEIAGESAIETDTFLRALGWRRIAEAEVGLLSPDARRYYEAYAAGVNAWLEQTPPGERGIQYTLLGLQGIDREPEPWTVADSLGFIRVVAWDLRHNPDEEAERALLSALLPPERVEQLYPEFRWDTMGTILTEEDLAAADLTTPPAASSADLPEQALAAVRSAAAVLGSVPGTSARGGVGSNSWTIDDARTESGGALLANDPHLSPSIPGLFTQMGLRCRVVSETCPFDVRGFSAASLPGIAIGHNGRIAWGWTTPYVDVADLFVEKVEGDQYLTEDGYVPLETRTETLQVAGADPVEVTLRSTRNGPIITSENVSSSFALPDLGGVGERASVPPGSPTRGTGYEVSLRWVSSTPGQTAESLVLLNTAGDWEEFTDALRITTALAQNIVYADAEGNTGYYIFGDIPIRRGYDGSTVMPGWTGDYEWVGTIPFDSKPHVYNPARGYLATANEQTVPRAYPFPLSADAQFSYRGDRIRGTLSIDDRLSVQDAADLQMDTYSWLADRLVPYLRGIELDGYYGEGQALLEDWDYRNDADSGAAAYFNAVYAQVLAKTFRDELPEELWPSGNGEWFVVLDDLLGTPTDPWWDDVTTEDVVETRDAILRRSLVDARDELTRLLSKDVANWEWGDLHGLDLVDPAFGTSGIAPVEWLFNRGPYPAGGGGNIVLANSWDAADDDYVLTNIPTFRMVVDFGDLDSSRWVNQSGQSGHPGHPHYDDQVAAWQTNDAPPMAWSDEAIRGEAEHTLVLRAAPA
jgi:penicillin amidase